MIIDLEHHFSLPESERSSGCMRYWSDHQLRFTPPQTGVFIDKHLWFMDEAGIDMAVLTGQLFDSSMDRVKTWNDTCARAVRDYPKRFVGFAGTRPLGGEEAFNELDRAVNGLGLKGVQISARVEGKTLDNRELWPFYEKVSKLNIPIDVHITTDPAGFDALHAPWGLYYVLARELDITATVFRICFGGVLEDFPDLIFLINHFGGAVSAVKDRMDLYVKLCGDDFYENNPMITKPWNEYFDKLYFSMAGRGLGMATVKCALTHISPRRLLFATDWPANFEFDPQECKQYIEEIRKLDLPEDDIKGILGGNAAKLLGLSLT